MARFATVDDYIAAAASERREMLERVRRILLDSVPDGIEKVRYDMPAVVIGGRYAIHYAAWKHHLGIYPVATAPEPLESELAPYRSGEDSINFKYSEPIDYDLVERIARFCAERVLGP